MIATPPHSHLPRQRREEMREKRKAMRVREEKREKIENRTDERGGSSD